jgi:hypothetical protein
LSANEAGKVIKVQGDVRVRVADTGRSLSLEDDSIVYVGDTVFTGREGKVKLLMKDESIITLGRSSTMLVRSYQVEPGSGKRKSVLALISGKLRALVNKTFGSGDSIFEVQTPIAIAGVRGTHLLVVTGMKPGSTQTGSLVACLDGEVYSTNRDQNIGGGVNLGPGDCSDIFEDMAPTSMLDCDGSGALFDYINDTTMTDLQGTMNNLMNSAAELEDLGSFDVQDIQDILSWTDSDAFGSPGDSEGETAGRKSGGSPLRSIPSGGSGGGGKASSPNQP